MATVTNDWFIGGPEKEPQKSSSFMGRRLNSLVERVPESQYHRLSSDSWIRVVTDGEDELPESESGTPNHSQLESSDGMKHRNDLDGVDPDAYAREVQRLYQSTNFDYDHLYGEADGQDVEADAFVLDDRRDDFVHQLLPNGEHRDFKKKLDIISSDDMSKFDHMVWILYGFRVMKNFRMKAPEERFVWVSSDLSALHISSKKGERDAEEMQVLSHSDAPYQHRSVAITLAEIKSASFSWAELKLDAKSDAQLSSLKFTFIDTQSAKKCATALCLLLQPYSCSVNLAFQSRPPSTSFSSHTPSPSNASGTKDFLASHPETEDTFMDAPFSTLARVDNYVLLSRLGESALYNIVSFLAFDCVQHCFMTVKYGGSDERDYLLQSPESSAMMKKINHPNIVSYREFMFCPDITGFFAVCEFIARPYDSLRKALVDGGGFDERRQRTFIFDILSGLSYLHKSNIAHLHLTLDCIYLRNDGGVSIDPLGMYACDFGDITALRERLLDEITIKGPVKDKDGAAESKDTSNQQNDGSETHGKEKKYSLYRAMYLGPELFSQDKFQFHDKRTILSQDSWSVGVICLLLASFPRTILSFDSSKYEVRDIFKQISKLTHDLLSSTSSSISSDAADLVFEVLVLSDSKNRPLASELLKSAWFRSYLVSSPSGKIQSATTATESSLSEWTEPGVGVSNAPSTAIDKAQHQTSGGLHGGNSVKNILNHAFRRVSSKKRVGKQIQRAQSDSKISLNPADIDECIVSCEILIPGQPTKN